MADVPELSGAKEYTLIPPRSTVCCGAAAVGGCVEARVVDQMPDRMGVHRMAEDCVEAYCPAAEVYVPGTGFVWRAPIQEA